MPCLSANPSSHSSLTEYRAAGSLSSAILLALTGGSLDAFIYLNHGHVFAAAMTGNGVLLGVAILHHDWTQALHHLLPIFGFSLGVFLASLLDHRFKHHAVTLGLLCEISVLLSASFLPGQFPDGLFVPLIAIVAAYQVTSFRRADTYAYNSTFMTGNLRSAVDGLYAAFDPHQRADGFANSSTSPPSSLPSLRAPSQEPSSLPTSSITPSGSSPCRSSPSSPASSCEAASSPKPRPTSLSPSGCPIHDISIVTGGIEEASLTSELHLLPKKWASPPLSGPAPTLRTTASFAAYAFVFASTCFRSAAGATCTWICFG
jgi:uncharacterized membrane protein YoaK (UPF0700 family)